MRKLSLLFVMILTSISAVAQFSAQYNTYMMNGLSINPGYAGSREVLSMNVLYSKQWAKFDGSPEMQSFNIHTISKDHKHGFSLQVVNEAQSIFRKTEILPGYAYHLKTGKESYLSMGVNGGISFQQSNWEDLRLVDELDENFMKASVSEIAPVAGSGLYFYSPKFYAGIAAPRIINGNSFSDNSQFIGFNNNIYFAQLGGIIEVTPNFVFKPSMMYRTFGFNIHQVDFNTNYFIGKFINVGLSYRTNNSFLGMIGVELLTGFDVTYSYGMNIRETASYTGATHEIMLRYELKREINNRDPRFF